MVGFRGHGKKAAMVCFTVIISALLLYVSINAQALEGDELELTDSDLMGETDASNPDEGVVENDSGVTLKVTIVDRSSKDTSSPI